MSTLLDVSGLTVDFGGLRANNDINLAVAQGQIVGLIGPNGAGKTTFVDALTGFVSATGSITFEGRSIAHLPAHRRSRLGLGRTWQSLELFDDLTVRENLQAAAQRQSVKSFLLDLVRPGRTVDFESVDFALETLGITAIADRYPTEISQGHRKLTSAARALAGSPKLICMDEPAAGLDSAESAELASDLNTIIDAGISILLIDHDMNLVLDVCDYIYAIDFGAKIAEGTPEQIRRDPAVVAAYLGASGGELGGG